MLMKVFVCNVILCYLATLTNGAFNGGYPNFGVCKNEGEVFTSCGADACQESCSRTIRFCTLPCVPGCICKPGLIRVSDMYSTCVESCADIDLDDINSILGIATGKDGAKEDVEEEFAKRR